VFSDAVTGRSLPVKHRATSSQLRQSPSGQPAPRAGGSGAGGGIPSAHSRLMSIISRSISQDALQGAADVPTGPPLGTHSRLKPSVASLSRDMSFATPVSSATLPLDCVDVARLRVLSARDLRCTSLVSPECV